MKMLPEKFTKKGFKHTLMKREGNVALYKRNIINVSRPHYEVVIITTHDGIKIGENYIEPGELYPSTSQWGNMGWTYNILEEAEEKFLKVLEQLATSEKKKAQNNSKKNSSPGKSK